MTNLEMVTVSKNEKREIVNIKEVDTNKHRYVWIEGSELTIMDAEYQPEDEILQLTKAEIEGLFTNKRLIKRVIPTWKQALGTFVDVVIETY